MIPVYIELLPWQNFTIATFVVMATSNVSQDAVLLSFAIKLLL